MKATEFGMVKTVGGIYASDEFPRDGGNCFRVHVDDPELNQEGGLFGIKVVNCRHENLEELIRRGELDFPICVQKIKMADGQTAVDIVDSRIPTDWLTDRVCGSCFRGGRAGPDTAERRTCPHCNENTLVRHGTSWQCCNPNCNFSMA